MFVMPDHAVVLVTRLNSESEEALSGGQRLEVLLLQKSKDRKWCLPGGHAEKTDLNGQSVCRREMVEELGPDFCATKCLNFRCTVSCLKGIVDVFETMHPDYDLSPPIVLSSEHCQYKWFPVYPVKATGEDVLRDVQFSGNLVRGLVASLRHQTTTGLFWPVVTDNVPLFPDEPGQFAAFRRFDVHTGVDLYCKAGTVVEAMVSGQVVDIFPFTGPDATPPSPWWNPTSAIIIKTNPSNHCGDGVNLPYYLLYGEIEPLSDLRIGADVLAGQPIGHVVTVLQKDKGRPMSMLHLEASATPWGSDWFFGHAKPSNLIDPTTLLKEAAGWTFDAFKLGGDYGLEPGTKATF